MGNSIEWIKISTRIFENRKIKFILSNKKGDKFFKIWIQFLTLAGKINDGGKIYISANVAYTSESLAVEFGEAAKVVAEALELFETLEMIRVSGDSIVIDGWEEHQNVEGMERVREQNRLRKQRQREREKENVTVTQQSREITQQNKNKNKNKNISNIVVAEYIDTTYPKKRDSNSNIFEYWDRNICPITPAIAEELNELNQEFGELVVLKGLNKMVKANAKNLNYLRKAVQGIASGNDYDDKPPEQEGFSGFGAIFEKLKKEAEEDDKQENSL